MKTCIKCRRLTRGSAISDIIGENVCFFSQLCPNCAKTISIKKVPSCRLCRKSSKALVDSLCTRCELEFKTTIEAMPVEINSIPPPLGYFLLGLSKEEARHEIHDLYEHFPKEGVREQ